VGDHVVMKTVTEVSEGLEVLKGIVINLSAFSLELVVNGLVAVKVLDSDSFNIVGVYSK
jgi:hypothetical protein